MKKKVLIHTDGACSGNPGPGGWGALLSWQGHERELCGWSSMTTNNRMEMLAAIRALEALKEPCSVTLVTDSQYLKNGMTQWMEGWKKRGWKTAAGKPVQNKDLWQRLERLCGIHEVEWSWTRGHNGHPENERVDTLARSAISKGEKGLLKEDQEGLI